MVSQLLTLMKMPHRVVPELNENYATPRIMPFSIWVAPENLEEAKRILAEGQVSDEELTLQLCGNRHRMMLSDKIETLTIDVRTLDPGQVLPNVGVVSNRGIWFPLG